MASTSSPQSSQQTSLIEKEDYFKLLSDSDDDHNKKNSTSSSSPTTDSNTLRVIAIRLSLYINVIILLTKSFAYLQTFSLSVLAALIDSALDVVSQKVLESAERHSHKVKRSSALYPAGAARLEPVGVLTCAALMGMASFEVMKESLERLLWYSNGSSAGGDGGENIGMTTITEESMLSFWGMLLIVVIKVGLMILCDRAQEQQFSHTNSNKKKIVTDSTLEALSQDHLNDGLSNGVAAAALLIAITYPSCWWVDPVGAILISIYIIYSWYTTGKEQIEQLTGKAAPAEFIDELYDIARNFDERMDVDVCRAYHFGPKFLVELEVVLPKDTLLFESHDLGMELQYEIEGREEVERCFVHIDYETRPYDEHVVSKVPELRERLVGNLKKMNSSHSV